MKIQLNAWRSIVMLSVALSVVTISVGHAADSANQYVGVWSGTWEGAGSSGRFDLTVESKEGQLVGGVSVGSDTGDYVAKFKSLSLSGNKLTAKYDYPPDDQGEIALVATLDGGKIAGEWSLLPKGADTAMAAGTWKVAKK